VTLILRRDLARQPRLPVSLRPEFTRGKSVVYVPAWGLTQGIVNGGAAQFQTVSATTALVGGIAGIGATTADTSGSVKSTGNVPTFPNGTEKSFVLYVKTGALATSYVYALTSNTAVALTHTNSADKWCYYDGSAFLSSGEALAANSTYCLLVCISAAGTVRLFRGGVLKATGSTTNYVGGTNLHVGSYSTGGLTQAGTTVYLAAIVDVDLTPFASDLGRNPWRLFGAQRVPIPAEAAAPPSFNPAWAIRNARTIGAGVI
jgi:hypothetical protein